MDNKKKAILGIGGLTLGGAIFYFYLGQALLDAASSLGLYDVPIEWYGYLSIGLIVIYVIIAMRGKVEEFVGFTASMLIPVNYSWTTLWGDIWGRFYGEYLVTLLVILVVYVVYLLSKKTMKATTQLITEKASSKWGILLLLVLMVALAVVLVDQGYIGGIL